MVADLIRRKSRYVSMKEVLVECRVSSKTLCKFKVSIPEINKMEGFSAPYSIFQRSVESCLRGLFSFVKTEQSFAECVSSKGFPLRFDFFIESDNLLIEADGAQHVSGAYMNTDEMVEHDRVKDEYATRKDVRLIRIPYTRNVTREYVLRFLAPPP
jgi:hypothetical protein